MTASNREACLLKVLAHEGGYTNHPKDPGGPTNWGITLNDARLYWKQGATANDVKAMPLSVAKDIYRQRYWDKLNCDDLPSGIDYSVFDYGVNSGVSRSMKVLRRVLLLSDIGPFQPDVLRALERSNIKVVVNAINDERIAFLHSLKTWPTFGTGWGRRVAEVRSGSLLMATPAAPQPSPKPAPAPRPTPTPAPLPVPPSAIPAPANWLASLFTAIASIFKRKTP